MRKLLLITLSVLLYDTTFAQKITTIAGGGLGDGGPAINTALINPSGIAVDGSGNIYILDQANNRIRKVTASTGFISTVAGNGTAGYGGDSSAAILANLNFPSGVAVDGFGNIYIADQSNHRIRKVTASTGVISTVAGNGAAGFGGDSNAATLAKLSGPTEVVLDGSGNIYISDFGNNRIRKVSVSTGIISTVAGNGTAGYSGDGSAALLANLSPNALAVDSSGNIYFADRSNNRIRKVAVSTGIISTVAGNGTSGYSGDGGVATSAKLYNPFGVALDGSGNIYIADQSNNRIRKVSTSTGIISTVAGNGTQSYQGDGNAATSASLHSPKGISIDGLGNIYIADLINNRVRKVTASTGIISTIAGNGTQAFGGDSSVSNSAILNSPRGLAVDGSGNIYIADQLNNRIRKISASTGIISTVAGNGTAAYGGDGSAAILANLNNPSGVAVDGSGNIYIADYNNHRIRKVTVSTGIISTVAGDGMRADGGDGNLATLAYLNYPTGIAIDGSGNIYISDQLNNRIRKVTASTGIISTVAGNGIQGYGGDGSAATLAYLKHPNGLAIDSSGNIYIADNNNHRIRKVTVSTGVIRTVAGNGTAGYANDGSIAVLDKLNSPTGLAVDLSGNFYIAENKNHRIRIVPFSSGYILTRAGNGTQGYGGDGSLAYLANLNGPTDVALDRLGNIYLVDNGNNRIRKVNNNFISGYSQTICAGSVPNFLAGSRPKGSTGSITYSWLSSTTSSTEGFTAISSTNNVDYAPGALTQNTWYRRIASSGTLTDTSSAVLITVSTPITNNTIISATQTICSGSIPEPILATTATGGNGTTYNYKWLKSISNDTTGFANAGSNDSIQNFTSNALTQNTWFKRKVISGACNADTSAALLVTVYPKPATSNITGKVNATILDTASYSVTGMSGSVFNWLVSGASIQSGADSNKIQVKWLTTGIDTIKVTETTNQGCVGAQKILFVNVTPGTGINELNQRNQVIIYPNPFGETIHITLLNNLKLEKTIIYDLVGNELIISNTNEIDASGLRSGIYLIMIVDSNGNSYTQKLIKN